MLNSVRDIGYVFARSSGNAGRSATPLALSVFVENRSGHLPEPSQLSMLAVEALGLVPYAP